MTAKKLLPGQLRFVPRMINKLFRIYDVGNASFPYQTDELGVVVQDVPEIEAQLEADRLNEQFPAAPLKKEAPAKKTVGAKRKGGFPAAKAAKTTGTSKTVEAPLLEAPAEYDMTEEDKAKYTEGLFEEVKY